MKSIVKNTIVTTVLIALFMSITTFGFSQPLADLNTPAPLEFKMMSNVNNKPLFELRVTGADANDFLIKVKDASGNVLYSETLKGKNIVRKYQLDMSEADFNGDPVNVRFEVTKLQTQETFVYNVSRNTQVVQDISIAKL